MILGFAGASFFSSTFLIPVKPGPAELIAPKIASQEKQPETATPAPMQRQQPMPAARERRAGRSMIDLARSRKLEPLVVRRIPVDPAIRAATEASIAAEQKALVRSTQPIPVIDPYDPNCNPERDICAGAKLKSRPRRVNPSGSSSSSPEQKENVVLKTIKKVIPGGNKTP